MHLLQAFGRAAELQPERMLPHTQSGVLLMALGELPAAEGAFGAALALQGGHPTAMTGLAATLLSSARRAAAQGAPGEKCRHLLQPAGTWLSGSACMPD